MSDKPDSKQLKVKYDETKASYASQALVQATAEEVFLDFSSGVMQDPAAGSVMPIHTRIAMSYGAAARLLNALGQTLQKQQQSKSEGKK